MVERRLSIPDRLALFREGLKQLPVEAWIDVLLQFQGPQDEDHSASKKLHHRGVALGELAHDYSGMLEVASSKLQNLAKRKTSSSKDVMDIAAALRLLVSNLRTAVHETLSEGSATGKAHLEPTDVISVIQKAVGLFNRVSHVPIQYKPPATLPPVRADAALLQRVLFNLFVNGLRAIDKGPQRSPALCVDTTLRQRKHGAGMFVEVAVTDSGCGIPKESRGKLFVKGEHDFPQGTGTGLAFCHRAMRAMGGAIYLKCPGKKSVGATFALRLEKAANP
jgi:signal transduction histidine kinase